MPGVTGGSPGEVGFPDGTGFGDVVGLPRVTEGVGVTGLVGRTAVVGLTRTVGVSDDGSEPGGVVGSAPGAAASAGTTGTTPCSGPGVVVGSTARTSTGVVEIGPPGALGPLVTGSRRADGVPEETFGPPPSPVMLPSTLAGPPAMKVIRATTDSAPAATANDSKTLAAAAVGLRARWRAAWLAMTVSVVRGGAVQARVCTLIGSCGARADTRTGCRAPATSTA